ncbi:MAG TPA: flavin reductase [Thermoanaerobaculia bacterium]|nr:flavin reductase [Thermoanaerobaculia bacterium]HUM30582.1 flavin reductase [Thermoanaerobaculia bacterium]HXK68774.1 flavin reductase [Thermoanaerobaculia bacterium]
MDTPLKDFSRLDPDTLDQSPFRLIGKDWMLITAGPLTDFNTMTASWGGLGILWNRPVSFVFVRPTRYTYAFMEKYETFTLSFFDEPHRDALMYCGTHSGRDVDKMQQTGLHPIPFPESTTGFSQSRLVLVCRTLSTQDIEPERFKDPSIEELYPQRDYHRIYIGEVLHVFQNVNPS